ncbi:MAG: NAD(P)-dependent oxidoreductase [Bacteroidota bacterium]
MIIITAPVHDFLTETLTHKGLSFLLATDLDYDGLLSNIEQATGIIVSTHIDIDKRMIDRAVNLKWIGRVGSGMEHIDVAYAQEKNIICVSSPEGNSNAVAECSLGLLLSLMRKIVKSAAEVAESKWLRAENRGTELGGKVVGIIGFGNTGSRFAKLLSSFEVSILAYDKYKSGFGNEIVKESNLDQIVKYADVISFHVPINESTYYMGNRAFFEELKQKPFILNSSRGKVINTEDLIFALTNQLISGAALDVLENEHLNSYNELEKKNFEFLVQQKNVIITPHIAGYSKEATYKMSKVLLEKLDII